VTVLEVVLHDEKSINVADITPGEDGSGSWLGETTPEYFIPKSRLTWDWIVGTAISDLKRKVLYVLVNVNSYIDQKCPKR